MLHTPESQVELEKDFSWVSCTWLHVYNMKFNEESKMLQHTASQSSVFKSHQCSIIFHCHSTVFTSTLTFYSVRNLKSDTGKYICISAWSYYRKRHNLGEDTSNA